ncbi:hyccin [Centruroides vittatus]|uniref:hyccin n=1 Tax=Centruroides vittatus TaxID=120091 RepID=UPI0035107F35
MADIIVREWLADYKTLNSSELHSFANIINENGELLQSLFTIFEERKYYQEFLDPVCHQLFSFYRSPEKELKEFTLQFIPSLIGLYLGIVSRGEQKSFRCVEILLLGIYNLEVIDSLGKPIIQSFRIPSISKPSIYHEPISLSHAVLTEHALSKLEYGDNRSITIGPFPEVEKINATNRLQVMTILMRIYNQSIGSMSKYSHHALCKMCSKTVRQGYPRINVGLKLPYNTDSSVYPNPRTVHRIPISSPFLLELIHAVYFSMFNGLSAPGLQALDDLHFRAAQELLSDVLLVTNGIRNSLKVNPSGQPNDGPMGISVALSPTTATTSVSKTIITNASFRTKKLPDDIPIQKEGNTKDSSQLGAITEEMDSSLQSKSSAAGKSRRRVNGNPSKSLKDKEKKSKKDKESTSLDPNSKVKEIDSSVVNAKSQSKSKGTDIKLRVECSDLVDEVHSCVEKMESLNVAIQGECKDDLRLSANYEPESLGEAMSCVSPINNYPMDGIKNMYATANGHGLEKELDEKYYVNSMEVKDLENSSINQTSFHQQTVV